MRLQNIAIRISQLNSVDQGNVIKNARKAKGLNQTQLAELISQSTSAEAVDVKKVSKCFKPTQSLSQIGSAKLAPAASEQNRLSPIKSVGTFQVAFHSCFNNFPNMRTPP